MKKELRIAGIVKESIADGPGIRMVIFSQGCKHSCPGCQNPDTHSFEGGYVVNLDTVLSEVKSNPLLDGITLSGGEPFEQAKALGELAEKVKALGLNVITYTGYTYEQIINNSEKKNDWKKLIDQTDILVDGRFEQEKKNLMLRFRGSENQRIIDVKKTMKNGGIVPAEM